MYIFYNLASNNKILFYEHDWWMNQITNTTKERWPRHYSNHYNIEKAGRTWVGLFLYVGFPSTLSPLNLFITIKHYMKSFLRLVQIMVRFLFLDDLEGPFLLIWRKWGRERKALDDKISYLMYTTLWKIKITALHMIIHILISSEWIIILAVDSHRQFNQEGIYLDDMSNHRQYP